MRHSTALVRHSTALVRHSTALVRHSTALVRHSTALVRHSTALVRHRVQRVVFAEPVAVGEGPGPALGVAVGPTGGHKELLRSEVCVETVGALMAKANSAGALRREKMGKIHQY